MLNEKSLGVLRSIASHYNLQRFKDLNKEELVNKIEMFMKSDQFQEEIEQRLTIPMIRFLNLLMKADNKCETYSQLESRFPETRRSPNLFYDTHYKLSIEGLIYDLTDEQGRQVICIPKEFVTWLEEFGQKQISEL
jgi:hypothetical protein